MNNALLDYERSTNGENACMVAKDVSVFMLRAWNFHQVDFSICPVSLKDLFPIVWEVVC